MRWYITQYWEYLCSGNFEAQGDVAKSRKKIPTITSRPKTPTRSQRQINEVGTQHTRFISYAQRRNSTSPTRVGTRRLSLFWESFHSVRSIRQIVKIIGIDDSRITCTPQSKWGRNVYIHHGSYSLCRLFFPVLLALFFSFLLHIYLRLSLLLNNKSWIDILTFGTLLARVHYGPLNMWSNLTVIPYIPGNGMSVFTSWESVELDKNWRRRVAGVSRDARVVWCNEDTVKIHPGHHFRQGKIEVWHRIWKGMSKATLDLVGIHIGWWYFTISHDVLVTHLVIQVTVE